MNNTFNSDFEWLYLESLTSEQEKFIKGYINNYLLSLDEYTENPSLENAQRLQLYSGPIIEIYDVNNPRFKNGVIYPAIKIIQDYIDVHGQRIDDSFNSSNNASGSKQSSYQRVLKTNQGGHAITEEDNIQMNAFTEGTLLIILSLLLSVIISILILFVN